MILDFYSGEITAKLDSAKKTLVSGVSFTLDEGSTLAIIGETGSGKTMTAMSLMGLLPSNVSAEGEKILFCGRPLAKDRRDLLGVSMVYIPQNGLEFLSPSKKVRHHLYDSLAKLGVKRREREKAALEKLAAVGFERPRDVIDKYPFQLSGGMAQRVTIAISACSRAKLVIADEPTNGLDHEAKVQFMDMLSSLFPTAAKLIITHDIGVAALCSRTLVLCGGKMMEKGPAKELLAAPRHPYTGALIGALVENGMKGTPLLRTGEHSCPFWRRCPRADGECSLQHGSDERSEWWCSRV